MYIVSSRGSSQAKRMTHSIFRHQVWLLQTRRGHAKPFHIMLLLEGSFRAPVPDRSRIAWAWSDNGEKRSVQSATLPMEQVLTIVGFSLESSLNQALASSTSPSSRDTLKSSSRACAWVCGYPSAMWTAILSVIEPTYSAY